MSARGRGEDPGGGPAGSRSARERIRSLRGL